MKKTILQREKIIIDTDPGHDDALAIMLLSKSGLFDIQAVTTVAGNSTIQNVTRNARYIMDLIGCKAPLFSGAEKPLARELVQANVHGSTGLAGVSISKKEKLSGNAVEKIISLIRTYPNEISIVMIGPETNIAEAFIKDKELPQLVKRLVIMGGAIAVPGNKNRVAEFNIFVDPEAARVVFDAPVEKILVPLDVCNSIVLTLDEFKRIKSPLLREPVVSMMKEYIKGIQHEEMVRGALLYDPLAAYYLINPRAFKLKLMDIKIETAGEFTMGMTVADRRIWGMQQPNVSVAIEIDGKSFVRDFFRVLDLTS